MEAGRSRCNGEVISNNPLTNTYSDTCLFRSISIRSCTKPHSTTGNKGSTVFATGQSVCPGAGRARTTLCHPLPSPTVPYRPASSSAVFQCFPMLPAIPAVPLSYPAVLCKYLLSTTRRCLICWGSSSSFLMTAVLEVQGPEPTAFCRPVRSFSKVV